VEHKKQSSKYSRRGNLISAFIVLGATLTGMLVIHAVTRYRVRLQEIRIVVGKCGERQQVQRAIGNDDEVAFLLVLLHWPNQVRE
jgi:hypothetical protein